MADTKIKIVGLGGLGLNAIMNMYESVVGPDFLALSNKSEELAKTNVSQKILLGKGVTTNHNQELGKRRVVESEAEIKAALDGYDIVIIVAGLGYGTGTGGAPVVASIAKELGALVISVCTTPFSYEGQNRDAIAKAGLFKLKAISDSVLVISNQKLLKTSLKPDFDMTEKLNQVNDLIRYICTCITNIAQIPESDGLKGIDAIKNVLKNGSDTFFGCGAVMGKESAIEALRHSILTPLMNASFSNASNVLLTISYSEELTLDELNVIYDEIFNIIGKNVDITYTKIINPESFGILFVSIFATGDDLKEEKKLSDFDKLKDAINPNNLY